MKGSTLHRQFDIIRHAATIAQKEWGWDIDVEMVRDIKIKIDPPSDYKRVSDAEIHQLLDAADGYVKATWFAPLIKFAVLTGLRVVCGNLLNSVGVTWISERQVIHVRLHKTKYPRRIPITSEIKAVLDGITPYQHTMVGVTDDALVFDTTVDVIQSIFKRVRKTCWCYLHNSYASSRGDITFVRTRFVTHRGCQYLWSLVNVIPTHEIFPRRYPESAKKLEGIYHEAGINVRFSNTS